MYRLDFVRPCGWVEHASRILTESWSTTSLRYSPEYLAWQFSFPGMAELPGVAAWDGDEPVGFAGATPRRMWYRGAITDVAVVSFVAVRPRWQGKQIAGRLYELLLEELRKRSTPIVTFALEGSAGERSLVRAYEKARFHIQPLGSYPTYGYLHDCGPVEGAVAVERAESNVLPQSVLNNCRESTTLWKCSTSEQVRHYRNDPRRRCLVFLRRGDNDPVGAAWIVMSELITPQGPTRIATIDSIFLPEPQADCLTALFRYASHCWRAAGATDGNGGRVIAPNLLGVDRDLIAAVGVRRMATTYRGYLCSPAQDDHFATADRTNLEVV